MADKTYKVSDAWCPHCLTGCASCDWGKKTTCDCCEVGK